MSRFKDSVSLCLLFQLGNRPSHLAASMGSKEILRLFKSAEIDIENPTNIVSGESVIQKKGETPSALGTDFKNKVYLKMIESSESDNEPELSEDEEEKSSG